MELLASWTRATVANIERALARWDDYFDRILFASDYPHWDFDDPFLALPPSLSEERRNKIYSGNAKALYRFD